jgi:four helix bundle protein
MELMKAKYSSSGEDGKKGFEDLDCYKLALDVMVNAHQLAKSLPADEKYDLVQQLRRSSKSVAANIAEGYGRFHYLDTLRFYTIARGSLNETLSHFITAQLLGYIDQAYLDELSKLVRETERTLNGLINYVRRLRKGNNLYGDKKEKDDYTTEYSYEEDITESDSET